MGSCFASPRQEGVRGRCFRIVKRDQRIEGVGNATSLGVDTESGALWLAVPDRDRVFRLLPDEGQSISLSLFQPFHVTLGGRAQ